MGAVLLAGCGLTGLAQDALTAEGLFAPADAAEHLALGNPSNATTEVAQPNNYLMAKPQYALSYNRNLAQPNWVSWHLDATWLGSAARQDDYRADPAVPAPWYQVQAGDYSGSGYDRGHMCPSADRTSSVATNSATFLMTNFLPQSPTNNRVTWEGLEAYSRTQVAAGNELYIISGGAGTRGTLPANCTPASATRCINIPDVTWKVLLVLPVGDNDVSRVTATTRTIAVIMPNSEMIDANWQTYLTSVDAVETLTGFDFFSQVSTEIQNVIESRVDGVTPASTLQLSSATYSINEGATSLNLTVTRTGTNLSTATVEYAVKDTSPGFAPCNTFNGQAKQNCDYLLSSGVLSFAAGETSKTFPVIIEDDNYVEGNETFRVELSNISGAAFNLPNQAVITINDNDTGPPTVNNINNNQFFVQQQYYDFLGRLPDPDGLAYWTGELDAACGADPACQARRIGVSAAFFIELEFQETGFVVYRLYRAAYGVRPAPEQTRAQVEYEPFLRDRGQLLGRPQLPASTQEFASRFVQRREFLARYPLTLSNAQYVNTLFDTAGLTDAAFNGERQAQLEAMNNLGRSRAQVLLHLSNLQYFRDREYHPSFVLMQYYGYLRRNPDQEGYDFWLGRVNQQPDNYHGMVCAFLTSVEYQERFSSVVSRSNAQCNGQP
jgi:endonuclease G